MIVRLVTKPKKVLIEEKVKQKWLSPKTSLKTKSFLNFDATILLLKKTYNRKFLAIFEALE